MKIRFLKWFMVWICAFFLFSNGGQVFAAKQIKPVEMSSDVHIQDTELYQYSYTEQDRIEIEGQEYAGIVIPIQQEYAGSIQVEIPGFQYITTSNGKVYCGLFDDMNFSKDKMKESSLVYELYKTYGETGTRYLVFYSEYSGNQVTTNIQFQLGLRYQNPYEMKENVVYKNYAKDSQNDTSATLNITKPGYYMFETNQDVKLLMVYDENDSSGTIIIPANNINISDNTNHKIMLCLQDIGEYSLSMYSQNGTVFDFSYSFYAEINGDEKLKLSDQTAVPLLLGDRVSMASLEYTAVQTGVVQIAGVSSDNGEVAISQYDADNNCVVYNVVVPISDTVTIPSKASFFVRKGQRYHFHIYSTATYGYVNASFQIVGFVEADVLGKPSKELAATAKESLQMGETYYGSFDRQESSVSWVYIDQPCFIHFISYKEKTNEGYTVTYYDSTRAIMTSYIQDDNKDVRFPVIEQWVPGYLQITDMAGNGYYTITMEDITQKDEKPEEDKEPQTPGGEDTQNPGGEDAQNPGGEDSQNPGGEDSQNPGEENSQKTEENETHKHSYDKKVWKYNSIKHWNVCSCGRKYNAVDHSLVWVIDREVSGDKAGVKHQECRICGYKKEAVTIPPKQSSGGSGVSNNNRVPETTPNVIETQKNTSYNVISSNKKEVAMISAISDSDKTITVPATTTIQGESYKVAKIANNAFKNHKKVTKIIVGKNVTSIGKNAFYGCKKLKNLTIKTTKLTSKKVAKGAFKGIAKSTTIKVPKKKLKAYKALFKKKGLSSKVKVKGY